MLPSLGLRGALGSRFEKVTIVTGVLCVPREPAAVLLLGRKMKFGRAILFNFERGALGSPCERRTCCDGVAVCVPLERLALLLGRKMRLVLHLFAFGLRRPLLVRFESGCQSSKLSLLLLRSVGLLIGCTFGVNTYV